MDGSKVKAYAVGGTGVVATITMILLAMALAQRDARTADSSAADVHSSFANQTAEGISHDPNDSTEDWPPPPVVRGNDTQLDSVSTPTRLAEPPSLGHFPDLPASSFPSTESGKSTLLPLSNRDNASLSNPHELSSHPTIPNGTTGREAPAAGSQPGSSLPAPLPGTTLPGASLPGASLPNALLPSTGSLPAGMPASNLVSDRLPPSSLPAAAPSPTLPSTSLPAAALPSAALPSALLPSGESPIGAPSDLRASPFASPRTSIPSSDAFQQDSLSGARSGPATAKLQPPTMPKEDAPQRRETTAPGFDEPPPMPSRNSNLSNPAPANSALANSAPNAMGLSTKSGANEPDGLGASFGSLPSNGSFSSTSFASPAPGTRQLDGAQNPSMQIRKQAPAEVQVGVPATFTLLVRNVGNATAYDVAVYDAVPKGSKLIRTSPTAQVSPDGKILWKLGEIGAGAEQALTVELSPEAEGELGSVASVTFAAQASVRTMSTQPKLVVKQTARESVLGGETTNILIEVTNTGTGTARGVELEEDVPSNMRHSSGVTTLGMTIGDLAPGETEKVEIELIAVSAGQAINRVRAISTNLAQNESSATIEVVLPKLNIQLEGPRLRYLERQATYRITAANAGTAIASDVELMLYLPRGMEFTSAANEGTYLPDKHAVAWSLAELNAGTNATTDVTLLPVQEGEFVLRMQCSAIGVNAEAMEKKVQVEGQSELAFSIEDDNDPIEADGFTTYIVRVSNMGTRVDNDVQLILELPEGASGEQVHAPVNHQSTQRTIVFAPIQQMQPKDQQIYRISVRHTKEGTHVVRAQLKSKNRPVPVIKEESTQVYYDH